MDIRKILLFIENNGGSRVPLKTRLNLGLPVSREGNKPVISEDLRYHFDNKISISENLYRYGSPKYFKVINEARELYKKGYGNWSEEDIEILESTVENSLCITVKDYL